jgi:S-DNA-T family DNA segregation ATPase FtsK/SpoIIIE
MNIFKREKPEEPQFTEDVQGGLQPTFQDKTGDFLHQFRRFGWDLLGTLFLLVAVLSLFGFLGFSKGTLLNPWIWVLKHNFGWGGIPFVFSLAGLGVLCFRHRVGKPNWFSLGKIISLESAFFSLLALFSLSNGGSLTRAESGLDGGVIGWGLANILWPTLPMVLAGFLFTVLTLVFLILGLGLLKPLYHLLLKWADSAEVDTSDKKGETVHRAVQRKLDESNRATDIDQHIDQWRDDRLPPLNLLLTDTSWIPDESQIKANARIIEKTLAEFAIPQK